MAGLVSLISERCPDLKGIKTPLGMLYVVLGVFLNVALI